MKTLFCALALGFCGPAAVLADEAAPLSHDEVKNTVDKHLADVKACMKQHGAATGKLVVEFAIKPDGHTQDAKPKTHSSNAPLDACIAGAFMKWQFPPPRGGVTMGVVYPFFFAAPAKPATIDDKQVIATVQSHAADVKWCYDEALKKKEGLGGKVDVDFSVAPTGAVTSVKVKASTTGFPALDECIVGKAKTWQFPKPTGEGNFDFTFPFVLSVPKPEPKKDDKQQQQPPAPANDQKKNIPPKSIEK
jgi:TonB family protein